MCVCVFGGGEGLNSSSPQFPSCVCGIDDFYSHLQLLNLLLGWIQWTLIFYFRYFLQARTQWDITWGHSLCEILQVRYCWVTLCVNAKIHPPRPALNVWSVNAYRWPSGHPELRNFSSEQLHLETYWQEWHPFLCWILEYFGVKIDNNFEMTGLCFLRIEPPRSGGPLGNDHDEGCIDVDCFPFT